MASQQKTEVEGRLWLSRKEHGFLGQGRMDLLQRIGELGSISRAAQSMGMSYKAAWDAVDMMNNLADRPLVTRERGGKHGGGAQLTDAARDLLAVFATIQQEHDRFLREMNDRLGASAQMHALARRLAMKTSARNQYWGTVATIERGAVNAEVQMRVGVDVQIVAIVTNESLDDMALVAGQDACALIKASNVILAPAEPAFRTSARNRLEGTVVRTEPGAVNSTVTLALGEGKTLTAVITRESQEALNLAPGDRACGLVKASQVILAVNG
ncbi:MAG TPA: TOBE domain-containing protein [bacterium]